MATKKLHSEVKKTDFLEYNARVDFVRISYENKTRAKFLISKEEKVLKEKRIGKILITYVNLFIGNYRISYLYNFYYFIHKDRSTARHLPSLPSQLFKYTMQITNQSQSPSNIVQATMSKQ